jgi:predicted nuclease of predicted toxin-antitoxin system
MNLTPAWVNYLVAAGHEATHWSSVGPVNAPDVVLMDHARVIDAVVLTHDLDFGAILAATGGRRPSVVQIRADRLSPEAIGPQLLVALAQLTSELAAGVLVTLDTARTRVSLLPIQID